MQLISKEQLYENQLCSL